MMLNRPDLLSDGVRGRVHPPPLDGRLVRRLYEGSVRHQLQLIVLQKESIVEMNSLINGRKNHGRAS